MNRRRFAPHPLHFVLVALPTALIVYFAWHTYRSRAEDETAARESYVEWCVGEGRDDGECRSRVTTDGDECLLIARHHSDPDMRVASPSIYRECIELTPDGWRRQLAERRRERHEQLHP